LDGQVYIVFFFFDFMRKTIVIAEDQRVEREWLVRIVSDKRYWAFGAENGQVALDYILQTSVQGLITDICMPEMDGCELIKNLARREIKIPIIVLSSMNLSEIGKKVKASSYEGEVIYFRKDVSQDGDNGFLAKLQSLVPLYR